MYVRLRPFGLYEGPVVESPDEELTALVAAASAPLDLDEVEEVTPSGSNTDLQRVTRGAVVRCSAP